MRFAKLCITVALATGGWHAALASALCVRRADCHAPISARTAGKQTAGHETQSHPAAGSNQRKPTGATAVGFINRDGHCGTSAGGQHEVAHAASHEAETGAAHKDGEDASFGLFTNLHALDSSCEHCVGRQTEQPTRMKSAVPNSARDTHAVSVAATRPVANMRPVPRPRFAPTEHSPPRGRRPHLLNSTLLI